MASRALYVLKSSDKADINSTLTSDNLYRGKMTIKIAVQEQIKSFIAKWRNSCSTGLTAKLFTCLQGVVVYCTASMHIIGLLNQAQASALIWLFSGPKRVSVHHLHQHLRYDLSKDIANTFFSETVFFSELN